MDIKKLKQEFELVALTILVDNGYDKRSAMSYILFLNKKYGVFTKNSKVDIQKLAMFVYINKYIQSYIEHYTKSSGLYENLINNLQHIVKQFELMQEVDLVNEETFVSVNKLVSRSVGKIAEKERDNKIKEQPIVEIDLPDYERLFNFYNYKWKQYLEDNRGFRQTFQLQYIENSSALYIHIHNPSNPLFDKLLLTFGRGRSIKVLDSTDTVLLDERGTKNTFGIGAYKDRFIAIAQEAGDPSLIVFSKFFKDNL